MIDLRVLPRLSSERASEAGRHEDRSLEVGDGTGKYSGFAGTGFTLIKQIPYPFHFSQIIGFMNKLCIPCPFTVFRKGWDLDGSGYGQGCEDWSEKADPESSRDLGGCYGEDDEREVMPWEGHVCSRD
jgi:hypothetical protein